MKRIVVIGPNIFNSGGIGTLFLDATLHFSKCIEVKFVDSRGKSRFPIFTFLRLPYVFLLLILEISFKKTSLFHINFSSGASFVRKILIARFILLFTSTPIVFQLHGSLFHLDFEKLPNKLKELVVSTLNSSAGILVFGNIWRSTLISLGVQTNLIEIITLGVPNLLESTENNQHFAEFSKASNAKEYKYILFCGNLTEAKGIDRLLEALAKLKSKNLRLIVVGEGNLLKWRGLAQELSLPVVFCGQVSNYLVRRILTQVDYFILPSRNENMPVTVIEAASAGIPIISSKVGAVAEYFNDSSALLLSDNSSIAIANALNKLQSNPHLSFSMSISAKDVWRKHFSCDETTKQLEKFWLRKTSTC